MKRDRQPELHFYEWRVSAWATSETRERLDAAGRGIYRELLDHCHIQGRFPDEKDWVCRKCACTSEEYERWWPVIEKHFPVSKTPGYRESVKANIVRREYFSYVDRQRKNRKNAINKAREMNGLDKQASTKNNSGQFAAEPNGNGNGNDTATATATASINTTTHAADAACDGAGPVDISTAKAKRAKGKRTTGEIRAALGDERLPWWENFWKEFPCKSGMNPAMDAFERKIHDRELAVEVYHGAKRYRERIEAEIARGEHPKVKYAQGWLNDERWTDADSRDSPLFRAENPSPRLVF